jgi:hypothetical protein
MALDGYRAFRDNYIDNGTEVLEILTEEFSPDFYNRDTSQVWDVSNYSEVAIKLWKGNTLTNRTLHEITIVNNSGNDTTVSFSKNYLLVDEEIFALNDLNKIVIPPAKSAYFYCTALLYKGVLIFDMRTGTQDTRKN